MNMNEENAEDIKALKNYALNAYLSTPKFVTRLTDISYQLIAETNRTEYLKTEILKINKMLPASVYIPFVNSSLRNYAILHIVSDEVKIFQTKERAPLLLCLEAFRPEELMLLKPEKPLKVKHNKKKTSGKGQKSADAVDPYRSNSWHSSYTNESELRSPLI